MIYDSGYSSTNYGSTGSTYAPSYSSGYPTEYEVGQSAPASRASSATLVSALKPVANDEIHLTLSIPEGAKVFVNGNQTTSTGSIRHYVSKNVESGATYRFEIRAEVERDGKIVSDTKSLVLSGGDSQQLNMPLVAANEMTETALTLNVPEGAKVTLAGNETKTEGTTRTYRTKGLKMDETWDDYVVKVEFDGVVKEKTIRLIGGDQLELSFEFGTDDTKEKLAVN